MASASRSAYSTQRTAYPGALPHSEDIHLRRYTKEQLLSQTGAWLTYELQIFGHGPLPYTGIPKKVDALFASYERSDSHELRDDGLKCFAAKDQSSRATSPGMSQAGGSGCASLCVASLTGVGEEAAVSTSGSRKQEVAPWRSFSHAEELENISKEQTYMFMGSSKFFEDLQTRLVNFDLNSEAFNTTDNVLSPVDDCDIEGITYCNTAALGFLKEHQALKQEMEAMREEMASLKLGNRSLKSDAQELRSELCDTRNKVTELENEVLYVDTKFENQTRENYNLNHSIRVLREQSADLRNNIDKAQEQREELRPDVERSRKIQNRQIEVFNRDMVKNEWYDQNIINDGDEKAHGSDCLAAAPLWDPDTGPIRDLDEEHLYIAIFGFRVRTARDVARENVEGGKIINMRGSISLDKFIHPDEKQSFFKLVHDTVNEFRAHEDDENLWGIFRDGILSDAFFDIHNQHETLKKISMANWDRSKKAGKLLVGADGTNMPLGIGQEAVPALPNTSSTTFSHSTASCAQALISKTGTSDARLNPGMNPTSPSNCFINDDSVAHSTVSPRFSDDLRTLSWRSGQTTKLKWPRQKDNGRVSSGLTEVEIGEQHGAQAQSLKEELRDRLGKWLDGWKNSLQRA